MSTFDLTIPGLPIAQGRPRCACRGKIPRVYDPARSRAWKKTVSTLMQLAARRQKWKRTDKAVVVFLRFSFKSKRRGVRTMKPDCDNLAKAILDAGNSVLWTDDSQVVFLTVRKDDAKESLTHITVMEWKDGD